MHYKKDPFPALGSITKIETLKESVEFERYAKEQGFEPDKVTDITEIVSPSIFVGKYACMWFFKPAGQDATKLMLVTVTSYSGTEDDSNTFQVDCIEAVWTTRENDTFVREFLKDLGAAGKSSSSFSSSSTGPKSCCKLRRFILSN